MVRMFVRPKINESINRSYWNEQGTKLRVTQWNTQQLRGQFRMLYMVHTRTSSNTGRIHLDHL